MKAQEALKVLEDLKDKLVDKGFINFSQHTELRDQHDPKSRSAMLLYEKLGEKIADNFGAEIPEDAFEIDHFYQCVRVIVGDSNKEVF